jgi:hypothetical protein
MKGTEAHRNKECEGLEKIDFHNNKLDRGNESAQRYYTHLYINCSAMDKGMQNK